MKKMLLFLTGNVAPQLLMASLFLWLAAIVSKEEFATLALLDAIYQGLLLFTLFGFDKAMERYSFLEKEPFFSEELLVATSLTCLGIGLTGMAIFFIVHNVTTLNLPAELPVDWIYFLLLASSLGAVYQIFVSYKYAKSDALSFAVLRAARAFIFVLVLSLVVASNFSVTFGRILADLASLAIPLIIILFVFGNPLVKHKYKIAIIKKIIPYSAPFVLTLSASFAINYLDRFFVARYLDLPTLANYALSQRVVGIVTLISSSIALAIPPLFYRNIEKDPKKVYSGIREMMRICFWLCIAASSLLPILLWVIYREKYSGALGYIPLLIIGVYFSVAISSSTAPSFLFHGRSLLNMITGLFAAFLSVAMNLILLPRIGIYGAIFAYIFSIMALYALQYFFAKRAFAEIPVMILQPILLFVACGIVSYLVGANEGFSTVSLFALAIIGISATILMVIEIKNAEFIRA